MINYLIYSSRVVIDYHLSSLFNINSGISTQVQLARINNQLIHIDRMLSEAIQAKPTWLLVVGHYPVFSKGEHGDISELTTYLLPLLEKYNVHAYFCGHDHLSEVYNFSYFDQSYYCHYIFIFIFKSLKTKSSVFRTSIFHPLISI